MAALLKDRAYTRHRIPAAWSLDASKLAFTVDDVLDEKECAQLVQLADASGWRPSPMAPLQTGLRARVDNEEWALTIFERLRPFCPPVHLRRRLVGVTPTFRFVKYPEGASVAPHPDTSGGDKHTPVKEPNASLFTILLYLNDGYEGCETCLLPSPKSAPRPENPRDDMFPEVCYRRGVPIVPKRGRALVFEHDILHACPPLRKGVKLVIRVDLCYAREDIDGKKLKDAFRDSTLSKGAFSKFAKGFTKKTSVADRVKAQLAEDGAKRALRDRPRITRHLAAAASNAFADSVCIVTGASAGIGAALCEAFACELRVDVVAVARRGDKLEALQKRIEEKKGARIICVVGDVTEPRCIEQALAACATPPVFLVCNAGVALDGAVVLHGNEQSVRDTFNVNTVAPALWSTAYFAKLHAAKAARGHVLHVSSLSAHRTPDATDLGLYAASKAALKALAEATRRELRAANSPYRVSSVSPGLVRSDFYEARCGKAASDLVYASSECLDARDVVDAALYALTAPPHVEVADVLLRCTASRS